MPHASREHKACHIIIHRWVNNVAPSNGTLTRRLHSENGTFLDKSVVKDAETREFQQIKDKWGELVTRGRSRMGVL